MKFVFSYTIIIQTKYHETMILDTFISIKTVAYIQFYNGTKFASTLEVPNILQLYESSASFIACHITFYDILHGLHS